MLFGARKTDRTRGGTDPAAGLRPKIGGMLETVGASGGGTGVIPYTIHLSSGSLCQGVLAGDGGTGQGGHGEGEGDTGSLTPDG